MTLVTHDQEIEIHEQNFKEFFNLIFDLLFE